MPDSELDSELLMRCAIKLQSFLSSQSDQETILAGTPIAVTPSGISSCSPRDEISVLELFLLRLRAIPKITEGVLDRPLTNL